MKKSIVRIICFVCLLTMMLLGLNKIFSFKYSDGVTQMSEFYKEDKNTVDVLVVGSSRVFVNFNTETFWDEYGIASYNLGGASQPFWNTYYFLKEALKTQRPQLVIIDAFGVKYETDYSENGEIIKNTYGMRWSPNKYEAIKNSSPEEENTSFLLDYARYHARYSLLKKGDFIKSKGDDDMDYNWFGDDWKGQYLFNTSCPVMIKDVSGVKDEMPMTPKSEEYYRKTIELAQAENIPIMVVVAPYDLNEYDQSLFNTAEKIAHEYGVNFLNTNLEVENMGLNLETDFYDACHMNVDGTVKFTRFVADYIKNNYEISDRRGDERYATWDRWAKFSKQYELNSALKKEYSIDGLSNCLYNPDYWTIISVDGYYNMANGRMTQFLHEHGIFNMGANGVWLIKDGEIKWATALADGECFVSVKGHDFHINYVDENKRSEVVIDNVPYEKNTADGVNIIVYDEETNMIVDSFGIDCNDCNIIYRQVE